MNEPLTVKKFHEFLLRPFHLPATGTTRTTEYFLPPERILSPLMENDSKKGEIII
jgi:hypothetical protein